MFCLWYFSLQCLSRLHSNKVVNGECESHYWIHKFWLLLWWCNINISSTGVVWYFNSPHLWVIILSHPTGIILDLSLANERKHYYVRPLLIGQGPSAYPEWSLTPVPYTCPELGQYWCGMIFNFPLFHCRMIISSHTTGTNLDLGLANERRHYHVRPSLIGRAHSQNGPCQNDHKHQSHIYFLPGACQLPYEWNCVSNTHSNGSACNSVVILGLNYIWLEPIEIAMLHNWNWWWWKEYYGIWIQHITRNIPIIYML